MLEDLGDELLSLHGPLADTMRGQKPLDLGAFDQAALANFQSPKLALGDQDVERRAANADRACCVGLRPGCPE